MKWDYTFTVFTSTYNRAHTLHRVYNSLQQQTYRDFEWLIIDDGSMDNTPELIAKFKEKTNFPIRSLWQENSGLHIAFNYALKEAKGKFFFPLDSDDAILPETLQTLKQYWDQIPEYQKDKFSGICCLCQDEYGNLIGDPFPKDVFDSDTLEIIYKYHIKGQKAGFHKTEVMREFPFEETKEMQSNPWTRIARKYKLRFINEPLEIFYQDAPQHSLSRGKKVTRPLTGFYRHLEILNEEIDWFWHAPLTFLHSAANYVRFAFHCGNRPLETFTSLKNKQAMILVMITFLVGYVLFKRDFHQN